MKKVLIITSEDNKYSCADCNTKEWLSKSLQFEEEEGVVFVSTYIQLLELRVAHKRGELLITKIKHKDKEIEVDKDAQLSDYPHDLFSEAEDLLDVLLGWS